MTVSNAKSGKHITLGTLDHFSGLFAQLFGSSLDISGYTVRLKNPNNEVLSATGDLQSALIPAGTIFPWCGYSANAPAGFLICNGAAVSRTTYERLFNAIGVAYGEGDGETTFNLPNSVSYPGLFHSSTINNTASDGYFAAQLPNITGDISKVVFDIQDDNNPSASGVFSGPNLTSTPRHRGSLSGFEYGTLHFSAHSGRSVYTDNGVVRPASIKVKFIIKY